MLNGYYISLTRMIFLFVCRNIYVNGGDFLPPQTSIPEYVVADCWNQVVPTHRGIGNAVVVIVIFVVIPFPSYSNILYIITDVHVSVLSISKLLSVYDNW